MKVQSLKLKVKSFFKRLFTVHCSLLTLFFLFTIHCSLFTNTATASDKWQGVDESVVEKFAKEHGREAREPFINTGQGDLLLFVFLLAGTIGGFAAGYYWKELMQNKKEQKITAAQEQERVHKE
ncbi:MAG: hypothetical protein NTW44_00375 [Nitrospirae bacterium]|nr:hypothetical protein [Nitrospirota bacterium]